MSTFLSSSVSMDKYNSWSYTSPDVVSQRLEHMVGASTEICDHVADLSALMRSSKHASNRMHAVKWIKEVAVMSEMSMDARDTSVQIFDRYFGRRLQHDPGAFDDPVSFSTVAAVSVLLSSKFHESRPLSMSSFNSFTADALSTAENAVLVVLDYNIVPLATPTSFIHHMLLLWPTFDKDAQFLTHVTDVACKMVGDFWEYAVSCRYAPSTIALAALMLAFSSLHVDCSRWLLDCVPDACLPGMGEDIFPQNGPLLLDIDSCLSELQKNCCSRNFDPSSAPMDKGAMDSGRIDSSSPVSIAEGFRAATPVPEAAALSLSDDHSISGHFPVPISSSKGVSLKNKKRIKLF